MDFIGVDGCKSGWFSVTLGSGCEWDINIYRTIGDLWHQTNPPAMLFIDIPIGLPESGRRVCDQQTRIRLGKRGFSVFTVPCRTALAAKTYRQACRINKQVTGTGFSIQCWNIASKIKEVDRWLLENNKARQHVRESHPELCFWSLAGRRIMAHPKKSRQGFAERCAILQISYPQTVAIVEKALNQFRRKDLARDDILDALVLAVSARRGAEAIRSIPAKPPRDSKGLPMEIVYTAGSTEAQDEFRIFE